MLLLYPQYEVCRGYIVFAFSVTMFVSLYPGTKYIGGIKCLPFLKLCLSVRLSVCILFSIKDFSAFTT